MSALLAMPFGLPAPAGALAALQVIARHRAMAWCAGLSLALHALLAAFALPHARDEAPPRQTAHAPARAPRPIELRLIAPTLPPAPAPAETVDGAAPATTAPPAPATQAVARPAAGPSREPAQPPAPATRPPPPPPPARTVASVPAADAPPTPAVAPPSRVSERDDYLPRPLLTLAPAAQAPVLIESPPVDLGSARHVGILALFIDEAGEVRHVAADGPPLPPVLEQAAREAFMAARFSAGQLDGRLVKSRIRVEVVFDNTPLK